MSRDVELFHEGLAAMEPRGRTQRVPGHLREIASRYVRARRRHGVSWREVSQDLGVAATTLQRWAGADGKADAVTRLAPVPVVVVGDVPVVEARSVPSPALVSPRGYRLEGLGVSDAIELFGRLG